MKKARQLAGEAAQTLSAYRPEPGGNYEPAIQQTRRTVKVTPATPLQDHRQKIIRSTPIMATLTERPRHSRTAQPTMDQPRIRTQATPHPPGAYPPAKFSTPIKTQIGRKKISHRGPCLYLHAVGPGNFWWSQWAYQMLTETGRRGGGFRYVWFPSAAALGL